MIHQKEVDLNRVLLVLMSIAAAGCAALPRAVPADQSVDPTAQIVIQTVLVTVVPMEQPEITPTQTPAPSAVPEVIVVTATGSEAAQAAAPTASPRPADVTATLPADPGGGIFTNMTRSGDRLVLRCQPDSLTFGVSTDNMYVTTVDFYYRIQDRLSVSISGWVWAGSLETDKHGNWTITFPASRVDQDLRSHRAWFDYQFVAMNKQGVALGRSAKIAKQVTYTIDCDD